MDKKVYRIGTRKSTLALKQVEEVVYLLKNVYTDIKTEIIGIDTYGDKDKITPISDIEGTDFFTKEIDLALLKGEIDFAVHSAKDLPDKVHNDIYIAAVTKSKDPYDAIVSKNNIPIENLGFNARVGASSTRRKSQLKKYREDLIVVDIRGTIEERLEQLYKLNLEAIIIAAIALVRLGLEQKITQRLPLEIFKTHPLQGALALTVRKHDRNLIKMLEILEKDNGN
jgi:hydroxymethylbilane synthase